MENKTVVGWDASSRSEGALRWAVEREAPRQGTLALVFVVEEANRGALGVDEAERQEAEAHAALRDATARLRQAAPECAVTTTVVRGRVVESLLEFVNDDWVLAVGAHGDDTARRRFSLSVGARVAAAARGLVAVIPDRMESRGTGVVVGIDGSPEADAAIAFAADEAERVGEPLVLVHAWSEPVLMEGQPILDNQFVEALVGESKLLLAGARERALQRRPEAQVSTRSVHGEPSTALVELATGAYELVLGSRGLRGIRRVLLGSVSRDTVVRSNCPTVIVGRAPEPLLATLRPAGNRTLAR